MSEASVAAEKAAWRERFRAARRARPPEEVARASAQIAARLDALVAARLADAPAEAFGETSAGGAGPAVALFWPLPGEPDLRPLARALRQRGVAVALPAVVGPRRLAWRPFEGDGSLVLGRWGLWEPPADAPAVPAAALALVAVPGLAFGRDGSRLGYGGGFYDAALAETSAWRVGVAVGPALVAAVPAAPHDARLDAVVTDAETWWVSRARP